MIGKLVSYRYGPGYEKVGWGRVVLVHIDYVLLDTTERPVPKDCLI